MKPERPAHYLTRPEYLQTTDEAARRVERLTEQLRALRPQWRLAPVVRRVSRLVAVALVTELGDLTRFTNPRQLTAFLGLVPKEHSSGPRRRPGAITKAGNRHARRALVEAAWAYHLPARVSRIIRDRQRDLPPEVLAIAWQAQLRLCDRYRRLAQRGRLKPVVITASARELAAFACSIARRAGVSPTPGQT